MKIPLFVEGNLPEDKIEVTIFSFDDCIIVPFLI